MIARGKGGETGINRWEFPGLAMSAQFVNQLGAGKSRHFIHYILDTF